MGDGAGRRGVGVGFAKGGESSHRGGDAEYRAVREDGKCTNAKRNRTAGMSALDGKDSASEMAAIGG